MAGHPVFHRAHTTCVGGHVAAEARRQFAGEYLVHQPVFGGHRIQIRQSHAGLDDGHLVARIDLQGRRHLLEGDEQSVGVGAGGSRQARAGTACGDRDPGRRRRRQQFSHLLGGLRPGHVPRRHRLPDQRLVVGVVGADRVTGQQIVFTDNVAEFTGRTGGVVAHGKPSYSPGADVGRSLLNLGSSHRCARGHLVAGALGRGDLDHRHVTEDVS